MTSKTKHVTMSSSGLCIEANSCKSLRRLRGFQARLVGQGIDQVRKFVPVLINDELHIADVVTGTIFDKHGAHHTDVHLQVIEMPKQSVRDAVEVRV